MHGYDVQDHQQLNPELGTAQDLAAMSVAAHEHGLGYVLDIVPNHMGVGSGNALWLDLLENGPSARAARFFDVEWHPVKEELSDKVLIPMLGDRYGAVLERGELKLQLMNGALQVRYYDHVYPVSPRSYGQVLAYRIEELAKKLPEGDPSLDELKSIVTAVEHLPSEGISKRTFRSSTASRASRAASTCSIGSWRRRSTGWRTGAFRRRRSTTAGSSTSTRSPPSASRTRWCSRKRTACRCSSWRKGR